MTLMELRHRVLSLEIGVYWMRNLKDSLENSLREVETCYLEAENTTYLCLLEEGEDFNLGDALYNSHSIQSIQKTTNCRIVDSKVMSEVNYTKVLRD
ncbi:hypothetical protein QTO34_017213 [Cnephaeus nilssonii]|uniref:Uncharacterized protein n=1 Tax=Cnephaeus nilssonii TaxID=3371016 RepID=A0AA40I0N7_CNENI|nr:hypothetical protein QTO34_017213 [Eptesicus nilssonii]